MKIAHLLFLLFKSYDEAAGLYMLAVERWPGSKWAAEVQKRLARMYVHIGDYEKADAGAAQFLIGHGYQQLKKAGTVAAAEADLQTREAYENMLEKYPGGPFMKATRDWLSRHVKSKEGGQK